LTFDGGHFAGFHDLLETPQILMDFLARRGIQQSGERPLSHVQGDRNSSLDSFIDREEAEQVR
jgi:hypothetical protein